ncbi:acyl carrier protein phosphodiesterase [Halopseudomonas xiamenensis]|uniref:acyl carrier protein phosphodiesterase n=1 Tax=Halopseudomonas xiamenensis TaxID=157792 RepID=UPI00162A3A5F|nr:ACP phosphodiesterase [Halopseudomonas xiamenensis]
MNFLAHLRLGPDDPQQALGGLLGDFVKGPVAAMDLPDPVRQGIWLHRRIDAFTDRHPLVLRSKARVTDERRRYAGIMVDMFYDHLLARHWTRFADQPLALFTQRMYQAVLSQQVLMPERARTVLVRMAEQDWLGSYAELANLHMALDNMARRLRPGNRLPGAVIELERDYPGFEADFLAFMPEVIDFAEAQAAALRASADWQGLLASRPNA